MHPIAESRDCLQPDVINGNTMVSIFRMRSIVIMALFTSSLIHFALTPEHLQDARLLGLGFFAVASCQAVLALIFVLRPAPTLWPITVILTTFSFTVYLLSRTLGLPFEGDHRHESIALVDLVCKGAELLTVVGLLASIHTTTRAWPIGPSLRMAPYNRYAYLVALVVAGAVAALYLAHGGHHR